MKEKFTAMVIGGANGLGLAITEQLVKNHNCNRIFIVDKENITYIENKKIEYIQNNLLFDGTSVFKDFLDVDKVFITIGAGSVKSFENSDSFEISNSIRLNYLVVAEIIKIYYQKLLSTKNFDMAVITSISCKLVSPLMATYAAAKSALSKLIQSLNIEIAENGSENRILEVAPGKLNGTKFYGGANDLSQLENIAKNVIEKANNKSMMWIPDYENIYKNVLERQEKDWFEFGKQSFGYKIERIDNKRKYVIGYLSGTFDLFHIGHLNLLRRAKKECDYLIVGVHNEIKHKKKNPFISYSERKDIVGACKYVDKVVEAKIEDSDAYKIYNYDKLFVGSDYKGSERFKKYEKYFENKGVEIVYFDYTQGTSSTQLREALSK